MSSSIRKIRPFDITRLGNCTDLWREVDNNNRQCIIGGFEINLGDIRKTVDKGTAANVEFRYFLDSYFYVADSVKNPLGMDVSELFDAGQNIDVIFDPLVPYNLDWIELEGIANRQGLRFDNLLDEIETRLVLFANRELQSELVSRLKEKQKEYSKSWTHFHMRITDFWKITLEVCLSNKEGSFDSLPHSNNLSTINLSEILDRVFWASVHNRWAYLNYIHIKYEVQRNLKNNLSALYDILKKIEAAIEAQINHPDGTQMWAVEKLITAVLPEIWINIRHQEYPEFCSYLCQPFLDALRNLDREKDVFGKKFLAFHDLDKKKTLIRNYAALLRKVVDEWNSIIAQYDIVMEEKRIAERIKNSSRSNNPNEETSSLVSQSIMDDPTLSELLALIETKKNPKPESGIKNNIPTDLSNNDEAMSADTVSSIVDTTVTNLSAKSKVSFQNGEDDSVLTPKAVDIILEDGKASTTKLRNALNIGYDRATRILDNLETMGIVGPALGKNKGRPILITREEWKRRQAADHSPVEKTADSNTSQPTDIVNTNTVDEDSEQ